MRRTWAVTFGVILAATLVFSPHPSIQQKAFDDAKPAVVSCSPSEIAPVKPSAAEIAPGASTPSKGPAERGQASTARSSNRETWAVKAVRKAKDCIATLKIVKK